MEDGFFWEAAFGAGGGVDLLHGMKAAIERGVFAPKLIEERGVASGEARR